MNKKKQLYLSYMSIKQYNSKYHCFIGKLFSVKDIEFELLPRGLIKVKHYQNRSKTKNFIFFQFKNFKIISFDTETNLVIKPLYLGIFKYHVFLEHKNDGKERQSAKTSLDLEKYLLKKQFILSFEKNYE